MSINIYDTANQLERDLRQINEFVELKEAHEAVRADEEANAVLTEFQGLQQSIFMKQQMGQEVLEEEIEQAQAASDKMMQNELAVALMEKERALNQIIQDINKIIMKPVQEIYGGQQ